jgi:hypothetical protein
VEGGQDGAHHHVSYSSQESQSGTEAPVGPGIGTVSEIVVLEDEVVFYCWEGSWEEELGPAGGQRLGDERREEEGGGEGGYMSVWVEISG